MSVTERHHYTPVQAVPLSMGEVARGARMMLKAEAKRVGMDLKEVEIIIA